MLNPELVEYGPNDKYGFAEGGLFGFGQLVGVVSPKLPKEEILSHTLRLGWANGCPQARNVIETYGLDWIMRRYSVCNFMFNWVTKEANRLNKSLYRQLTTPTPRIAREEVGEHEPFSVPASHKKVISPMSGLYGYAIPRLLLLRRDSNLKDPWEAEHNRDMAEALIVINLGEAKSLKGFLASLVNDLSHESDLEKIDILSHALPSGILKEENCYTTYREFAEELIRVAPDTCRFYQELTPSQKDEKGIADILSLR